MSRSHCRLIFRGHAPNRNHGMAPVDGVSERGEFGRELQVGTVCGVSSRTSVQRHYGERDAARAPGG